MSRPRPPKWWLLATLALVAVVVLGQFAPTARGQTVREWAPGVFFGVGAVVTFQGGTFQCLQAHTSQPDWQPPSTPALWQAVSTPPPPSAPPGSVFSDGFETDQGWTRNAAGTDNATTGLWERGDPEPTDSSGPKQLGSAFAGTSALVTGLTAGSGAGANDIDGGVTSIQSPAITLPSGNLTLSFRFYLSHLGNSSGADLFRAQVVGAGGTATTVFEELGTATDDDAGWGSASVSLNAFAGQTIRLRFVAADNAGGSLVEAGVDDVAISRGPTPPPSPPPPPPPGGGFPARVFAPYVDVLLGDFGAFKLAQNASNVSRFYTLAFVNAFGNNCEARWGGIIPLAQDAVLAADIAELRRQGGNVIVSFGGANGNELAQACTSDSALLAQYQAVVTRYGLTRVDFDVEGAFVQDQTARRRRHRVLAQLRANNPGLRIQYTLPVLPSGLTDGVGFLQDAASPTIGFVPDFVNIMAMDYGASFPLDMGDNAVDAVNATVGQLMDIFGMSEADARARVGVTPMIGQNDVRVEFFRLDDASQLLSFAQSNGTPLIAMWSANRDRQCNGAEPLFACSQIPQAPFAFSSVFRAFTSN